LAAILSDYGFCLFTMNITTSPRDIVKGEPYVREALAIYRRGGLTGEPVLYAMWILQMNLKYQKRTAEAEALIQEALALAAKTPDVEYRETASLLHSLAELRIDQTRYEEAERLARRAVAMHRRASGAMHPETGWALLALGRALKAQLKLPEAVAALQEALKTSRGQTPYWNSATDWAWNELEPLLEAEGKPADESVFQWVLDAQRSALGENSLKVARTLIGLGRLLDTCRQDSKAAECRREAAVIVARAGAQDFCGESVDTLYPVVAGSTAAEASRIADTLLSAQPVNAACLNDLAWALATYEVPPGRNPSLAVALAQRAVATTERKNPNFLDSLAAAHAAAGQFTQAIAVQQEAIQLLANNGPKGDLESRLRLYQSQLPYREHGQLAERAGFLLAAGRFNEAEPVARECLAIRERQVPEDWQTFNAKGVLGGSLLGQGKFVEAEPLLLAAYQGLKQREPQMPAGGKLRLKEAIQRLKSFYESTGQPEQAGEWGQKLAEADQPQLSEVESAADPATK